VGEVLREIDADLVALQEVESSVGEHPDVLAFLGAQTGSQAIPGTTMMRGEVHYGNAILTRLPVLAVRRHDLGMAKREPRGAIDADLDLGGKTLQMVATHLGLRPGERRRQVRRLLPLFRVAQRDLVVLGGDLNEWFLWGRPLRMLHRLFPDTPHARSFPAGLPLFSLDRVWVHPRPALLRLAVHASPLARMASDHLPVVATIETS
jgi:endonuclease/exonuclease/phosphatase family metal-dependent hydrolase